MKIQQNILKFYVACFFVFSAPAFFLPAWFAAQLGYEFEHQGALMEFIAAYGGLIMGIGIYLIYCLKNQIQAGLVCILTVISSLFIGRVIGYAIEQEMNNIQATFLIIELITILLISGLLYSGHKLRYA
jgi:hypothetical protein